MSHGGWDQPERPAPTLVRRLVPAVVIAVLLGAGTTLAVRYATTDHHHPTALPSPTESATTEPPYLPVVADPTPSPSPSPSHRAARVPAPRRTPVPSPTVSASPSTRAEPMYLTPTKGLCRYIDFKPMTKIDTADPKHDKPEVIDKIKPGDTGTTGWYLCQGGVGNVGMRWVGVEVYADRALAAQRWAKEKSTEASVGMDFLPGLGDDAYAFYLQTSTIYKVVVVCSNLYAIIDLQVPYPDAASFKTATVETTRSILKNLPTAP
jgi:hypothetical protein